MATAGGSAPAIVMKGNAGAAEHDGGLALAGPIRADVHALEKLLAKATGDAKEKLTEQVTELYLKVKGYSLADARPGAQCVARQQPHPRRPARSPPPHKARPSTSTRAIPPCAAPGRSWWQRPRPCWQRPRRPSPPWRSTHKSSTGASHWLALTTILYCTNLPAPLSYSALVCEPRATIFPPSSCRNTSTVVKASRPPMRRHLPTSTTRSPTFAAAM